MNQQRDVIYDRRRHALLGEGLKDDILEMLDAFVRRIVDSHYEAGDIEGLRDEIRRSLVVDVNMTPEEFEKLGSEGITQKIVKASEEFYKSKETRIGPDLMRRLEQMAVLQVIDEKWKEHLREMDDLKEGIHLRAYGQKDPLLEYKAEGFRMFVDMLDDVNKEALGLVFKLFPAVPEEIPTRRGPRQVRFSDMTLSHQESLGMGFQPNREPISGEETREAEAARRPPQAKQQPIKVGEKIGRNDPCPCGSGKKYKQCHGK
jgi:preprotein translocase subunit SecA